MARELLLPNSTQIPDVILDFWLSELSGAELKVVFYIARRTYGFRKLSDNISLSQICTGIKKRDGTVLDTGTGLSRSSVARAVKTLEEQGIILRKINLSQTSNEHEESTYSLNLDWHPRSGSGGGGKVVPKSNHPVSKDEGGWSQNRTTCSPKMKPGVVPKSNPQETDQETDQETAAGKNAAELVEELVSHDLNRGDAIRFVREKPGECRRQLEFLNFLIQTRFVFKKSKPGYLHTAIKMENGPPKGYREEKTREGTLKAQKEKEAAQTRAEIARQSYQEAQEGDYLAYLASSRLPEVEKSQPRAFMAFQEAEATKRAFYERTKSDYLSQFDTSREYLLRFAAFFEARPEAEVLSFWDWDSRRRANRVKPTCLEMTNNPLPLYRGHPTL